MPGEAAGAAALEAPRQAVGRHAGSVRAAAGEVAAGTAPSAAAGEAVAGEHLRVAEGLLSGRQGTASAGHRRDEAGSWASRSSRLRRCGSPDHTRQDPRRHPCSLQATSRSCRLAHGERICQLLLTTRVSLEVQAAGQVWMVSIPSVWRRCRSSQGTLTHYSMLPYEPAGGRRGLQGGGNAL